MFFEAFIKGSIEEYDINFLYCASLPGYTLQWGMEHTDNKSQTFQDKEILLLEENNVRGGISSVMSDRYVESNDN